MLAPAFAADSFPDQPGALSPAEIQAATRALRVVTRNVAEYKLIASGRRGPESPLPSYAVFALPPAKVSDRIAIRRHIVCNFTRVPEKWQCARPQVEARVQAEGVEHIFPFATLAGAHDDARIAGEVVDFMYSPCFGAQHRALAGPQAAPLPAPRSISSVTVSPGSIHLMTGPVGAEDTYALERNAGKKKQECAFSMSAIHLGKGGALVAQKGASEVAPGALSPAEIQAATEAMRSKLGTEPALKLIVSGRRSTEHLMQGYAVFAGPPVNHSERIKIRRKLVCNLLRTTGSWQCLNPHDALQVKANGMEHVFSYVVIGGPGDSQEAVDIADYLYSPCFAAQFKALGGEKAAPPFNKFSINVVMKEGPGAGYTVRTGLEPEEDVYLLQKTTRKADGCGLRIVNVRMDKTGVTLPEGYAREVTKQAEQARAEAREKAIARTHVAVGPWSLNRMDLAERMMIGAVTCGLAALVIPWLLLLFSRRWAAATAGVLALVGTILFMTTDQDRIQGNIRIDLIIIPVLLLVAWVECAGLGAWALRQKPAPILGEAPRIASRIPLVIAGIVGSTVVALALIFAAPTVLIYLLR